MSKHALINATAFETRLVITDDGRIDEVFIERTQTRSLVGNIYLGTVIRVLPAMGSVFIDIGRERSAFLSQSDIMPSIHQRQDEHSTQSKLDLRLFPKVGERIVVQVTKDEISTKGVRVTMHVALAGRYLVYLPTSPQSVGVSTRIGVKAHRNKLKAHLMALLDRTSLVGGVIARSTCKQAFDDETLVKMGECMQAELDHLCMLWADISQARTQASLQKAKHALLYQELPLAERALRDIITDDIKSVWIDDKTTYQQMLRASHTFMPSIASAIYHHDKPTTPLFAQSVPDKYHLSVPNIETQLADALLRRCPLPSGGYLIIEHTEAMTTIDVNTGSFVGQSKTNSQSKASMNVAYETNKEAVTAIARELKVRNISGIIILDFIDMDEPTHRQMVPDMLAQALKSDSATTNITQISKLGLIEMTRKRTRLSLSDELCVSCPTCHGTGRIKSLQTVAFEILRSLMSQLASNTSFKKPNVTIQVNQAVADHLSSHQDLSNLQKITNSSIHLSINTTYHQEQYVILVE